jgi:serine protease Do
MSRLAISRALAAVVAVLALGGSVAVLGPTSDGHAQALITGGARANFGVFGLRGGFMPDPAMYPVLSGGSIPAASLGLAPNCRGYVTAQPDVIVHYSGPARWVRFFFRGAGDTTLVINDGAGRWWCDDDSGGSLNPMIDMPNPAGGQYDIWVGSYRAGENIQGQLGITEIPSMRP